GYSASRPDRRPVAVTEMLRRLGDAAALTPSAVRTEAEPLVELAHAFAQEVYPELMDPSINSMPWWQTWVAAFPGAWRGRVGLVRYLFRRKEKILFVGLFLIPFLVLLWNVWLLFDFRVPRRSLAASLGLSILGLIAVALCTWLLLVGTTLLG